MPRHAWNGNLISNYEPAPVLQEAPIPSSQLSVDRTLDYVKHVPNGTIRPHLPPAESKTNLWIVQIVNAGNPMQIFSGSYYKAAVHRVFQPPADQRWHTRVCAHYLVMTDNDDALHPLAQSPVLQRWMS